MNASVWDSLKLLEPGSVAAETVEKMKAAAEATPACPSFMHLHLGFDATGGLLLFEGRRGLGLSSGWGLVCVMVDQRAACVNVEALKHPARCY